MNCDAEIEYEWTLTLQNQQKAKEVCKAQHALTSLQT